MVNYKQTYECLAFMRSAIKCGEPWTGTAEAKYQKALKELESDWDLQGPETEQQKKEQEQ